MAITVVLEVTVVTDLRHHQFSRVESKLGSEVYRLYYNAEQDIPSSYIRNIAEVTAADSLGNKFVEVAIPDRYKTELYNYLQTELYNHPQTGKASELLSNLDFARYMDDEAYINVVIDGLFDHWSLVSDVVYNKLDDATFEQIMLRAPYDLLPDSYKRNKSFRNLWFESNRDRTVSVDGYKIYHLNVVSPEGGGYLENYYTINGLTTGTMKVFDTDSNYYLQETEEYVNGKVNGLIYKYANNGLLISAVVTYKNNVSDGPGFPFSHNSLKSISFGEGGFGTIKNIKPIKFGYVALWQSYNSLVKDVLLSNHSRLQQFKEAVRDREISEVISRKPVDLDSLYLTYGNVG